ERLRRDEHARRRHGVDVRVDAPVSRGRGDVHRPVTRATDVCLAALLERLIRSDHRALIVNLAIRRLDLLAEHVFQLFVREVAFFLRELVVEAEVWIDDEPSVTHSYSSGRRALRAPAPVPAPSIATNAAPPHRAG